METMITTQLVPSNSHFDSLRDIFLRKSTMILHESQKKKPQIDKKRQDRVKIRMA